MREYLPFLLSNFIILVLFAVPGQLTMAAGLQPIENNDRLANVSSESDCGCQPTPILGSERNKMVADLISSDEFKFVRKKAEKDGYSWGGAKGIDIEKFNHHDIVMIGVTFEKDGLSYMFVFIDGEFVGASPN